ncbi:MAG: hypothetical protein JO122_04320 [Acetobacteraceae bacterium]|nr:hypothetical protein [Acetobacteraceae bacterium]
MTCPYPPVYHDSYAGYVPAFIDGRPALGEPPWDNPFTDYTQRTLAINPTVGDAQAANEVLQTATPWPPYSNNTNIPGSGPRMVRAVHGFESGGTPPFGPALPPPVYSNPLGASGGGGGGGGAGAASTAPTPE